MNPKGSPMLALIGGTGLAEALFGEVSARELDIDTPFGRPSAAIRVMNWNGVEIATLARHGVGHTLAPSQVPYRANIYALKSLGVTHIVASGAVGSLREELRPRELVIADQVIDKTCRREASFFDRGLAVHVELAEPFCPNLRALLKSLPAAGAMVHPTGTYVCMEGPAFSTRAESLMHSAWGGDLIGMTAMPEAKLAREAEIAYALVALVTDYDCWRPHPAGVEPRLLLDEIIGNLRAATGNAVALLRALVERVARDGLPASPAHDALRLAIWSEGGKLEPGLLGRYGRLLEKYF